MARRCGSHHLCRGSLLLAALLQLIAAPAGSAAQPDKRDFSAVVVKIFDGDSFLVRPENGREVDVRLIDVDAPEKNQPYGPNARATLERLIGGRRVFIDVIDIDRYQRKLARVYRESDRLDVSRALVRHGCAWVYRRVTRDRSLVALQDAARASRAGLWALPTSDRTPPWRFRRIERSKRSSPSDKSVSHREH